MWRCMESLAASPLRLSITPRIEACSSKSFASRSRVRSAGPWTSCRAWIKSWRRFIEHRVVRGLCDGEVKAAVPIDAAAFAAEFREALPKSFQFLVHRVERGEFGGLAINRFTCGQYLEQRRLPEGRVAGLSIERALGEEHLPPTWSRGEHALRFHHGKRFPESLPADTKLMQDLPRGLAPGRLRWSWP